ncbi:GNAT family N-acetyltransferase [Streptomyces sp. NPDC101733]|uniref:GNAT family N-acetyltransferase n=1 Tax=unclassified Streptomyces TaxID=2593676 RepID=UPI003804DFFA
MDQHVVRPVRAEEWERAKGLRIAALQDPAAPVAFLEVLADAKARPDVFWQERTARAADGRGARQFVAEGVDGVWDGSVTMIVEEAGSTDFFGETVERGQGHLVGVFVREEQRGGGLADALFAAALEWAWSLEGPALERVRLFVHAENPRAAAFYRRSGFVASGRVVLLDDGAEELEYVVARGDAA